MKKITLLFCLALFASFVRAQNGLDSIWVEIYYVSNTADSVGSADNAGGTLPANSITYRLWACMQPGYKLQAAYGVDNVPLGPSPGDHSLLFNTTTSFFNNENSGNTQPCGISVNNVRKNSVMVDSWFSMGCNASGKVSVPKSADTDGALVNNTVPPMLQNNDPLAGIPISVQDGMIAGTPPSVTIVGIPNTGNGDLGVFDATSQVGNFFSTSNGSIAVLGGVMGPDSADNKVLIGQFTTDGTFCYKLNLQVGTPSAGVEQYVADSAMGNEIVLPSLMNCLQNPVGIPQPENNAASISFSIYPNPVGDELIVSSREFRDGMEITIYNVLGEKFFSRKLTDKTQRQVIDVSGLKTGIYFIEARVDGVVSHQKFVKN